MPSTFIKVKGKVKITNILFPLEQKIYCKAEKLNKKKTKPLLKGLHRVQVFEDEKKRKRLREAIFFCAEMHKRDDRDCVPSLNAFFPVGVQDDLLILFTYLVKYTQVFWMKSLQLWTAINNGKALKTETLPQIENLTVDITVTRSSAWYMDQPCLTLSKHISSILFISLSATQFEAVSLIKDKPCFFPLPPHTLFIFWINVYYKNLAFSPFASNCCMDRNKIIIILSFKILILLFQRAENIKILTSCSFLVERPWKKDSLTSVHSFLIRSTCRVMAYSISIPRQLVHPCQSGLTTRQKAVIRRLASIWRTWAMEQPVSSSSFDELQVTRFGEGQVIYALKVQLRDSLNSFRGGIAWGLIYPCRLERNKNGSSFQKRPSRSLSTSEMPVIRRAHSHPPHLKYLVFSVRKFWL